MLRVSDARLDQLIAEDVPYIDLTCEVLGITGGGKTARMSYYTRDAGILCGTEEAARMCEHLGLTVVERKPSRTQLASGDVFLVVEGPAECIHMAWKVCLNMFDHCSAVATKAHQFVTKVKQANPTCEVLTTRKSMPGTKDLVTKAVMCGGAFPHRLGLSETVLVFDHHLKFVGGFDQFLRDLPTFKQRCVEKKLFIEVGAEQAIEAVKAGVDGVQLEKIPVEELAALVPRLRELNPHVSIIAAGGINLSNCVEYAATGIDGIATTCLFSAPPLDMSVRIEEI